MQKYHEYQGSGLSTRVCTLAYHVRVASINQNHYTETLCLYQAMLISSGVVLKSVWALSLVNSEVLTLHYIHKCTHTARCAMLFSEVLSSLILSPYPISVKID